MEHRYPNSPLQFVNYDPAYSIATSMISLLEEHDPCESRRPRYLEELRQTVEANVHSDVSIEEFVHHVWGTPREAITTILQEDWTLDNGLLTRYQDAFATHQRVFTPRPHTSFRGLCAGLINDVYAYFGLHPRDIDDEFVEGKGKNYLDGGKFTERDPDFVMVWKKGTGRGKERERDGEDDCPLEWDVVKAFVEFSAFRTVDGYSARRPPPKPQPCATREDRAGSSSIAVSSESDTSRPQANNKRRRLSTSSNTTKDDTEPNQSDTNPSSRPTKRPRLSSTLTPDQLRLAAYAVECLGGLYQDRQYVTGIFVDVCKVSLWYFDRQRVMRTVEFDFSDLVGMRYLALVLFALTRCDMHGAGFDPIMKGLMRDKVKGIRLEPLRSPYFDPDEYCITFPKSDLISELCVSSSSTRFWVVENWIDRFGGLIGNGAATFLVREGATAVGGGGKNRTRISKDMQVLKYAWQPEGTEHEEYKVDFLRKRLSDPRCGGLERHLPQRASWSGVYDVAELGVPWTRMNLCDADGERKELHVSVGKLYGDLWEVGSIQEFKIVFLDYLESHYRAYKEGGILHGAICENSMKVLFPETSAEGHQPRSMGILTNWEVGPHPREENDIPLMHPHDEIRDGEGPFCFVAVELAHDVDQLGCPTLNRSRGHRMRVQHCYRHDLESFFYVLLWACVHYDLEVVAGLEGVGHRDLVPAQGGLSGWLYKDSSWEEKTLLFVEDTEKWEIVQELVKSGMKEVFEGWVVPLREMFTKAFDTIPEEEEELARYDLESCNGRVTFETFMQAIGETPRWT